MEINHTEDVYSWLLLNADSIGAKTDFEAPVTSVSPELPPDYGFFPGIDDPDVARGHVADLKTGHAHDADVSTGASIAAPHELGAGLLGSPSLAPGGVPSHLSMPPPAAPAAAASATSPSSGAAARSRRRGRRASAAAASAVAAAAAGASAQPRKRVKPEEVDDTEEELDPRKRTRLEKNRASARESRRRKREYVQRLESRVTELESEVAALRLQLRLGRESVEQEEREKSEICQKLQQMVRTGAPEQEMEQTINMFGERYADYGRDRRSLLKYHLDQVQKLMTPTQVTKMCMWSLNQDDEFYEEEVREDDLPTSGTIWHQLARHLEVTEEQKQRIKSLRTRIRGRANELKRCMQLVRDLRRYAEVRNESMDSDMQAIQSVLT
eukprot:CAMPEP_0196769924 /NCGR_PEP_ID=MMETSP1104-20130614/826_1 /TAXON_ID=33652 /ORGANISM="Cafeteria sp., Strain Caron Lab Isolate" /LENGTH=382 /DNA_ID=CAMNT_0042140027 /DNA_START=116 /DNA_END=1260 /DNA_ORIENTATION=+